MSDPSNRDPEAATPGPTAGPTVLDPVWEDVLRAGQSAEGGAGSVEHELAVVHLFRHAVGPERPDPSGLADVWSAIESELDAGRTPWWSKMFDWRVATGLATAAAAAAVIVLAWPGGSDPVPPGADPNAVAVSMASKGAELEAMFSMLEGPAREALVEGVDQSRGSMRGDLLALATRDAQAIPHGGGGAP